MIDHILQQDFLPPSVAASALGKFGLFCSTLFGSRFRAGHVRARQHTNGGAPGLTPDFVCCLKLMKFLVGSSPAPTSCLRSKSSPLLLYLSQSGSVGDLETRFVGAPASYPIGDYGAHTVDCRHLYRSRRVQIKPCRWHKPLGLQAHDPSERPMYRVQGR